MKSPGLLQSGCSLAAALAALATSLSPAARAAAPRREGEPRAEQRVVVHAGEEPLAVRGWLSPRAYLGVQLVELTPELRAHFGVPEGAGILVSRVGSDSPAERSGIEVGDILTAIDGEPLRNRMDAVRIVAGREDGERVEIELWRGGEPQRLWASLEVQSRPRVDIATLLERWVGPLEAEALPELHLDPEIFGQALENLHEHLESPEWEEQVRSFHELRSGFVERLERLEERLRELERELEQLPRNPR